MSAVRGRGASGIVRACKILARDYFGDKFTGTFLDEHSMAPGERKGNSSSEEGGRAAWGKFKSWASSKKPKAPDPPAMLWNLDSNNASKEAKGECSRNNTPLLRNSEGVKHRDKLGLALASKGGM